jgi:hypothetical protein
MDAKQTGEVANTRRQLSPEDTAFRSTILHNAIDFSKDKLRRDSALINYTVASVQTLRELNHPLVFHLMNDLAFNLQGKDSFSKACRIVGIEVPPAIESTPRKPRVAKAVVKTAKAA